MPCYYIPGDMPPPAKTSMSRQDRRKLSVAMFVRLGQRNFVSVLPGSNYDSLPPSLRSFVGTKDLRGEEYVRQLRCYAYRRREEGRLGSLPTGGPWPLVCDRDPSHNSRFVSAAQADIGFERVFLPPQSSDLDPLDYGIFGAVKRRWHQLYAENRWDWDTACRKFIDMLQKADADKIIRALPGRMEACIKAGGKHFEYQYKKGHAARAKAAKAQGL